MSLNRFYDLEALISTSGFITTDKYLEHTRNCFRCDYSKRDFLYQSGKWRGERIRPKYFESRDPLKKTLIIGHSDKSTDFKNVIPLLAKGYNQIWAVNAKPFSSVLNSLPLGLTNKSKESPMHDLLGNFSLFSLADQDSEFPMKFNGDIYGNFSLTTNSRIRKPLAALLLELGSSYNEPKFTREGRIDYLKSLRRYSLTVCPEGNGIDTHRLWETLYMGGTPVITESNVMAQLVKNLPVIVINSWEEVGNLDLMEEKWHALGDQDFDFRKLTAGYWIQIFCDYGLLK